MSIKESVKCSRKIDDIHHFLFLGALVNEVGYPGFNTKAPFITDFVQVTVRPQTSILEPISAITKDGVQNTFNDVQVMGFPL